MSTFQIIKQKRSKNLQSLWDQSGRFMFKTDIVNNAT